MAQKLERREITSIVIGGDSLSDDDNLNQERILGFISMGFIAGLGKSPRGNFTNGLIWNEALGAKFANRYMLSEIKKAYGWDDSDTADAIITGEHHLHEKIQKGYSFDKPGVISLKPTSFRKVKANYINTADLADDILARKKKAHELAANYILKTEEDNSFKRKFKRARPRAKPVEMIRNFALGGATAHDYRWSWIFNLKLFFTRLFVSNLDEERKKILDYDKKNSHSKEHLSKALYIDWIGANDLITVNSRPTFEIVDKAIAARIKNLEALKEKGYLNFVSINMPDLSRTPRFQNMQGAKGEAERKNAQDCCIYFNQKLAEAIADLKQKYPDCTFNLIDAYGKFNEVYDDPKDYGFDKDKLNKPYTESDDFINNKKNKTSPANGYLFWDDLHPSADMGAIMAEFIDEKLNLSYVFNFESDKPEIWPSPFKKKSIRDEGAESAASVVDITEKMTPQTASQKLLNQFLTHYKKQLDQDSYLGLFHNSKLDYKSPTLSLFDILKHGIVDGPNRTTKILRELEWINNKNEINCTIYGLGKAVGQMHKLYPELTHASTLDEEGLRDLFMKNYNQHLSESRFFKSSNLSQHASLTDIINHGLEYKNRTRQIMERLGWLKNGNLNSDIHTFKTILENQQGSLGMLN